MSLNPDVKLGATPFMKRWPHHTERIMRRILPRSFFGRSLLIVFIPLLITQIIALQLFYGNYLNLISRRMADSVVAEIALTIDMLTLSPHKADIILQKAYEQTALRMHWHPERAPIITKKNHVLGPMDEDLTEALWRTFHVPCRVEWRATRESVRIELPFNHGRLDVFVPRKRLDVGPVWLFVAWAAGSALILFIIATLFIGKQVRAIRRLVRAAENFGLGRDDGPIHPMGAQEIRKAAVAFNRMQARVNRFVAQRTAVLAGVSHDLRTPLTRLRLSLAMIPSSGSIRGDDLKPDLEDMISDVDEMGRLIESYLSFARGEGAEEPVFIDLADLIRDVVVATERAGGEVKGLDMPRFFRIRARPDAMRRALTNLADNARLHGGAMSLCLRRDGHNAEITIDDDGIGIAEEKREEVFRPFLSRSESGSGGSGLGLTIARDIVHAHGGDIRLLDSPMGGLRVKLILPI